jgi:hypothetical protein
MNGWSEACACVCQCIYVRMCVHVHEYTRNVGVCAFAYTLVYTNREGIGGQQRVHRCVDARDESKPRSYKLSQIKECSGDGN